MSDRPFFPGRRLLHKSSPPSRPTGMSEILCFPFAQYPDWVFAHVGVKSKLFEKKFDVYKKHPDGF